MKPVYVDSIERTSERVTYGIAAITETVLEDVKLLMPPSQFNELIRLARKDASQGGAGINFFTTYGQFIVGGHITGGGGIKIMLNFVDCHNDIEAALEECSALLEHNWKPDHLHAFMQEFRKIQDNPPNELAEMILKDPLSVNNLHSEN